MQISVVKKQRGRRSGQGESQMREYAPSTILIHRNVWMLIALVSVLGLVCMMAGCGATATNNQTLAAPAGPTINVVRPGSGPASGGTVVNFFGAFIQSGVTVSFGGTPSPTVSFLGSSQIAAITPAHAAGTVDIVVANPGGGSTTILTGFTFTPAPTVITVTPATGSTNGGTGITITGTGFQAGAAVTVGGINASSVIVVSSTQLTAVAPAHPAGPADVTVTNPDGGTGTLQAGYTYGLPPSVTSIFPTMGATIGGTVVMITGAQFQPGATVTFGGVLATGIMVNGNGTTIQATTPAHASGVVDVTVTNPPPVGGSATLAKAFTYFNPPPSITGIAPNMGTAAGGTVVIITGQFFQQNAVVTFAAAAATAVTVSADGTMITATTPAGTGGTTVNVTVTNPDNQSATLPLAYTYQTVVHSVDLMWVASTSPVSGYNVYRGTVSGGPYVKINAALIPGLLYTDSTVTGNTTYYYVATAVDSSNNESVFSNEAQAIVPGP
jgi:hypothetical protein